MFFVAICASVRLYLYVCLCAKYLRKFLTDFVDIVTEERIRASDK